MSLETTDYNLSLIDKFMEEFERRRSIIASFIRNRGRVSFRDFVWANLYHPDAGYYVKGDVEIMSSEPYDDFEVGKIRHAAIKCAVEDMFESGEVITLNYLGDEKKIRKGFEGVVVADEYFTSLPFHIVKNRKKVCVEYDEDFKEVLDELDDLEEFLDYAQPYIKTNSFAVCTDAVKKAEEIASKIEEGYMLVIDYGLPVEEYYTRKLRLACFSRGSFSHNPYTSAGKRAISAPVDFTAIIEAAEREEMVVTGFTSYRYFLLNTIGKDESEEPSSFKSIAMPVTLKVLVMQKGIRWRKLKCLQSVPTFGYWIKYNKNLDFRDFSDGLSYG
jgi:SAM-dependent MidA family methyltransferase